MDERVSRLESAAFPRWCGGRGGGARSSRPVAAARRRIRRSPPRRPPPAARDDRPRSGRPDSGRRRRRLPPAAATQARRECHGHDSRESGCRPPAPPLRAAATGTAAAGKTIASQIDMTAIKKGGHITEAWNTDIRVLNPIVSTDVYSGYITSLVFDGLVDRGPGHARCLAAARDEVGDRAGRQDLHLHAEAGRQVARRPALHRRRRQVHLRPLYGPEDRHAARRDAQ